MGLISHAASIDTATDKSTEPLKKKNGLLRKIVESSVFDNFDAIFSAVLRKADAEKAGIYVVTDVSRSLIISEGFDLTTIHRFYPDPKIFGVSEPINNEWIQIDPKKDSSLFQGFFSSHEWSGLESLIVFHLSQITDAHVFIIFCSSSLSIQRKTLKIPLEDDLVSQLCNCINQNPHFFDMLLEGSTCGLPKKAGKDRLNSAVNAGMTSTLLKIDLSRLFVSEENLFRDSRSLSLYRLLLMNISRIAGSTNIMVVKNSLEIRISLFSSQKIDSELYKNRFLQNLHRNFGIQRISKLDFEFSDSVADMEKIYGYLYGDA